MIRIKNILKLNIKQKHLLCFLISIVFFSCKSQESSEPVILKTEKTKKVSKIVINEIVTSPKVKWSEGNFLNNIDFSTPSSDDQFIEIKNIGNTTLDLTNWKIEVKDSTDQTILIQGDSINSFEYYSTGSSVNAFRPNDFLVIGNPSGVLSNTNLTIIIKDSNEKQYDKVEINSSKLISDLSSTLTINESFSRQSDGSFLKTIGTPRVNNYSSKNGITLTYSQTACVNLVNKIKISEVVANPKYDWGGTSDQHVYGIDKSFDRYFGNSTSSASDEFIEMKNLSGEDLDITGWTVEMNDSSAEIFTFNTTSSGEIYYEKNQSENKFVNNSIITLGNLIGSMNNDTVINLKCSDGTTIDSMNLEQMKSSLSATYLFSNDTLPSLLNNGSTINTIKDSVSFNSNSNYVLTYATPSSSNDSKRILTTSDLTVNKVILSPSCDWDNSGEGGDGISYSHINGNQTNSSIVNQYDRFIELENTSNSIIDLSLVWFEFIDSSNSNTLNFSLDEMPQGVEYYIQSSSSSNKSYLKDFKPGDKFRIGGIDLDYFQSNSTFKIKFKDSFENYSSDLYSVILNSNIGSESCDTHNSQKDYLKISAFNIKSFGTTKASNTSIINALKMIIERYDLIMLNEIKSESAFNTLFNEIDSSKYSKILSEEVGDSSGEKEFYAFIYNKNKLKYISHYIYADTNNTISRDPLIVYFEEQMTSSKIDLSFIAIHARPDHVVNEVNEVSNIINELESKGFPKNYIVLGDFNADGSYLSNTNYMNLTIKADHFWPINKDQDTAVLSDNAYDRFVVSMNLKDKVNMNLFPVFYFDKIFDVTATSTTSSGKIGLGLSSASSFSDHYPIQLILEFD